MSLNRVVVEIRSYGIELPMGVLCEYCYDAKDNRGLFCDAVSAKGYVCCRPMGHSGRHVACAIDVDEGINLHQIVTWAAVPLVEEDHVPSFRGSYAAHQAILERNYRTNSDEGRYLLKAWRNSRKEVADG